MCMCVCICVLCVYVYLSIYIYIYIYIYRLIYRCFITLFPTNIFDCNFESYSSCEFISCVLKSE